MFTVVAKIFTSNLWEVWLTWKFPKYLIVNAILAILHLGLLGMFLPSTAQFPSVVSFPLPHIQSDLNYIFNFSTIAFFYVFLSSLLVIFYCSTFCSSCHFFTYSLFYLWYHFPLHFFYPVWFFLACYFVCSNLQGFFYLLQFLVENSVVILFFLFFHHLLDFSFFISILYVMIQHQCCILYSLFCRLYSCFHLFPCVCCTEW